MRIRGLLFALCCTLLSGCYYPQQTKDYEVGYNFLVAADSLSLQSLPPLPYACVLCDTLTLYRDMPLVVAEVEVLPYDCVDSVWVKVAANQEIQGWLRESELLASVVPDNPISQAIYLFSDIHLWVFFALTLLALSTWLVRRMLRHRFPVVHVDDIPSPYPMFLCLTLAVASVLYASMQKFVPETWEYFYFHPTLNPFGLPLVLGLFLSALWLMLILFGASLLEIRRCLRTTDAILYTLSLVAFMALLYVVFSLSALYYAGYILLPAYAAVAVVQYWRRHRARYLCGHCGTSLHALGHCPKCGTMNV